MIPKLKGGTNTILMGNIKGMPNNQNNRHKMKDIQTIIKDKDIVVIAETATT